jgi:hypothetical protein
LNEGEAGEKVDDASVEGALEVDIGSLHPVKFQVLLTALDHGLLDEGFEGNFAVLLIG